MALYKRSETVRDFNGVVVSKVSVKVVTGDPYSETSPLASLFQDAAGLIPLANPLTADAAGQYSYWAAGGTYSEKISRPGYYSVTNDGFLVGGEKGDTGPMGNPGTPGPPGLDVRPLLSDGTDPANGSGMVAHNESLMYPAGSIGKALQNRLFTTDLAETMDPTTGANMVGLNTALGYAAGTVGAFLKNLVTATVVAGASLIGYLSPLAGAVAQTVASVLNSSVSVKTFGAVGDGVADDSAAVAAAIASGIGRIFYPPGTYKITNVVLGSSQTHYGPGATITSSGSAFILPAGPTQHITFDGLTFAGTGNAIYTAGIYLNASWVIKNCSFGRTLAECIYVPLILSSIKYNHFGTNNGTVGAQHRHLYLAATAASGVAINENTIIGNRFNSAAGAVASTFIQYGSGNTFTGNDWEGNNGTYAVHIDGGGVSNFYGNWFESNAGAQQIYMEASGAITFPIYYNTAINFIGNVCNLLIAGNAALFYLDANSYHLSMIGNLIYTNITPVGTVKVTNTPVGDNSGVVEFRNNANFGNSFGIVGLYSFAGNMTFGGKGFFGGTTTADGVLVGKGIGAAKIINLVNTLDATAFYVGDTGQISTGALANSPYNSTTASAANLVVLSNGVLQRSTSAAKYKTDVRDLESLDITKLRAVRYKSLGSADDPTLDHFGLIADEALGAGFKELVMLGENGEPEGFQYERLTAVLLKDLQDLRKEFAEYKLNRGD